MEDIMRVMLIVGALLTLLSIAGSSTESWACKNMVCTRIGNQTYCNCY